MAPPPERREVLLADSLQLRGRGERTRLVELTSVLEVGKTELVVPECPMKVQRRPHASSPSPAAISEDRTIPVKRTVVSPDADRRGTKEVGHADEMIQGARRSCPSEHEWPIVWPA
jgi:hypothetical protein